LRTLPVDRLVAAAQAALRRPGEARLPAWAPTVDGRVLPAHPFDPAAPAVSAGVPLLIGTNLNEGVSGVDNPSADSMTEEELRSRVAARYGDRADAIIAAYRREYPRAVPFDLFS